MREILFRGKRKDNGEWVDGDLRHGGYYFGDAEMYIFVPFARTIINHPVVPKTVGQYTGLRDKNGKRIFEDDLCDMSILGNDHTLQKIVIRYGAFGFEPIHPNKVHPEDRGWQSFWRNEHQDMWNPDYFTVIGNIHDNPELLGGDNA